MRNQTWGKETQFSIYCNSAVRGLTLRTDFIKQNLSISSQPLLLVPHISLPYVSIGLIFVLNKWSDNFGGGGGGVCSEMIQLFILTE